MDAENAKLPEKLANVFMQAAVINTMSKTNLVRPTLTEAPGGPCSG